MNSALKNDVKYKDDFLRLSTDPFTGMSSQQVEVAVQRDGENKITTPIGNHFQRKLFELMRH